MRTITIGIPRGSLQELMLALFARAGFGFYGSDRSLWISFSDPQIKPVLLQPPEIPLFVASGNLDCGLTGLDWVAERNCADELEMLTDLCHSKGTLRPVRWVFAVSQDSPYRSIEEIKAAPHPFRVSTELKATTERWLAERGILAEVHSCQGAAEGKVPLFADAIVESTEIGESVHANSMRILDTVLSSTTAFYANKRAYRRDESKRRTLNDIALLLRSCIEADAKVIIQVRAPRSEADVLKALVPSDVDCAVWEGQTGDVLLAIIADKEKVLSLVPVLARNGAAQLSVTTLDLLYLAKCQGLRPTSELS